MFERQSSYSQTTMNMIKLLTKLTCLTFSMAEWSGLGFKAGFGFIFNIIKAYIVTACLKEVTCVALTLLDTL